MQNKMLWSNGFLEFFQRPKNKITTIKITTFLLLVHLPSTGEKRGGGDEGTPTLFSPLHRASKLGPVIEASSI
jgi:hypothetical protein